MLITEETRKSLLTSEYVSVLRDVLNQILNIEQTPIDSCVHLLSLLARLALTRTPLFHSSVFVFDHLFTLFFFHCLVFLRIDCVILLSPTKIDKFSFLILFSFLSLCLGEGKEVLTTENLTPLLTDCLNKIGSISRQVKNLCNTAIQRLSLISTQNPIYTENITDIINKTNLTANKEEEFAFEDLDRKLQLLSEALDSYTEKPVMGILNFQIKILCISSVDCCIFSTFLFDSSH